MSDPNESSPSMRHADPSGTEPMKDGGPQRDVVMPIEGSFDNLLDEYGVETTNNSLPSQQQQQSVIFDNTFYDKVTVETDLKINSLLATTEDTNNGVNRLIALVERVMETNKRLEREIVLLKEDIKKRSFKSSSSKLKRRESFDEINTDYNEYSDNEQKTVRKKLNNGKFRNVGIPQTSLVGHIHDSAGSKRTSKARATRVAATKERNEFRIRNKQSNTVGARKETSSKITKIPTTDSSVRKRNLRSVQDSNILITSGDILTPKNSVGVSTTRRSTNKSNKKVDNHEYRYQIGFAHITTERMCRLALHGEKSTENLTLNELYAVRNQVKTISRFGLYCRAGDLFSDLINKGYTEDETLSSVDELLLKSWKGSWYHFVSWMRMSQEKYDKVFEELEGIAEKNRFG